MPVVEFGELPLANRLLADRAGIEHELRVPLSLVFCPSCGLLQIRETVDPEVLFSHYVYFSSVSDALLEHSKRAVESHIKRFGLSTDSFVVEVASNDGYLLKNFVERDIPVLGIDPAANIAGVAEGNGVRTRVAFFGADVGAEVRESERPADLIIANNVFAHVADTRGFVEGIANLLADTGTAAIEFPYGREMVERLEFDTIYHEHLCYFLLHPVKALAEQYGLHMVDVERYPIHGGSLRVFLQPAAHAGAPSDAVVQMLADERDGGLLDADHYRSFAHRILDLRDSLVAELTTRKTAGQKLAAYGASAKGSTLLNHFGIGADLLDFIADRSPAKQGHLAPGVHIPIVSPEALVDQRPDAVLLLTWNFADEIIEQQADYLRAGGEFIIPLPKVRVVGKERIDS